MTLQLSHDLEQMINARVESGKYPSAADVIRAAMQSLAHDEERGQFEPEEWDRLLAEAEQGGPDLDGEAVLKELHNLRKELGV